MPTAKDLRVEPISPRDANRLVRRWHYSGNVSPTSTLHLGGFLGGRCEGVMQFGRSMQKSNILPLVSGTSWNGFVELNRLAFTDRLPRNSESRALSVAFRIMRKAYPQIEWIISFADGTQSGDGGIYRAAGFHLTGIKANSTIWQMPDGFVFADVGLRATSHNLKRRVGYRVGEKFSGFVLRTGAKKLQGFQFRYIYFLTPTARERLTVPVIPFSRIAEMGAEMYRGEKITRAKEQAAGHHPALGGVTPTRALQIEKM